jgi:hypothetical protein
VAGRPPSVLPRLLLAWATLLGVPLWVGWAARVRREQAAAERTRRADEERLRVARELHDVVSHSIAIINFRAGVALHVLDRRPSEARDALEAILAGSAGAMHELRAALGVLRQGDGSARAPLPDLVALGLANDEIAGRLVVSPATVRTHGSRAMTKLHARDRAQLVVFAYQSGLAGQARTRPT